MPLTKAPEPDRWSVSGLALHLHEAGMALVEIDTWRYSALPHSGAVLKEVALSFHRAGVPVDVAVETCLTAHARGQALPRAHGGETTAHA